MSTGDCGGYDDYGVEQETEEVRGVEQLALGQQAEERYEQSHLVAEALEYQANDELQITEEPDQGADRVVEHMDDIDRHIERCIRAGIDYGFDERFVDDYHVYDDYRPYREPDSDEPDCSYYAYYDYDITDYDDYQPDDSSDCGENRYISRARARAPVPRRPPARPAAPPPDPMKPDVTCTICLGALANTVFFPCRHLIACSVLVPTIFSPRTD